MFADSGDGSTNVGTSATEGEGMAEYTLEDIFEDVTLELDGNKFRLRQRTRALGEKTDGLETQLNALQTAGEDTSEDDVAAATIELLDIVLEPLGDGKNGTRTHAKTVLKKAWEGNRIGVERLIGLLNFCQEKMSAALDPTSTPTNGV